MANITTLEVKNMSNSPKNIIIDFSNPQQVTEINQKYKDVSSMLESVNQNNEQQFISFGNEEIVLTTYQKNGWIRKNYYSAESGEPEGEAFKGKWK
jgi:hypothetical protein